MREREVSVPAARAALDRQDRFEGCFLGLALGDALGARFEGGPVERFAWKVLGRTLQGEICWTDDTQMSLDVAESLIANGEVNADDLARRFAESFRLDRGYGIGSASILQQIAGGADWREVNCSVFPDGSFGNGAAMRAPAIGLFCASTPQALAAAAHESARVTHAHPLGIEGAVLIARATLSAVSANTAVELLDDAGTRAQAPKYCTRIQIARAWLEQDERPDPPDVVDQLGNGIAAVDSCVTAIYLAARFLGEPFLDLQQFVTACGGDTDTIGAMSGAIWGAANGAEALPKNDLDRLEQVARLRTVARALHAATS